MRVARSAKDRTHPLGLGAALAAGALALSACAVSQTSSPTTTTQPAPAATTTTHLVEGPGGEPRAVAHVDCDSAPADLGFVCEAYSLIQRQYVDEISSDDLLVAASHGLEDLDGADTSEPLTCVVVDSGFEALCDLAGAEADSSQEAAEAIVRGFTSYALDTVSAYIDPEELELLEEEQQGQIEGIGALVLPEDQTIEGDNKQCTILSETCRVLILSTIEGSPAEAAGLQEGDVFVAVNGTSVLGWSVDRLAATVRGPAGTDVTITLDRAGTNIDVTITRATVVIPVIESEVIGDTGYVRLQLFTGSGGEQFQFAVAGLLTEGVDRLVVDLRDNPGGLLTTAIDVASVFLADGDVVVTKSPTDTTSYPVKGVSIVPADVPVIFVVNKGSASASELVSAVLQERGRATVVGENTFGKNTVQQRFGLSNGGAVKLTIARWLTPGGLDFGGVGVTPDIPIDFASGIEAKDLVAAVLAAT